MLKTRLIVGLVILAAFASCANLPTNPTASDIQAAQNRVLVQQIAYTAVTTPIIANLKGDNRTKALAADAVVQQLFTTALGDAAAGRNVDNVALAQAILNGERVILGLQANP